VRNGRRHTRGTLSARPSQPVCVSHLGCVSPRLAGTLSCCVSSLAGCCCCCCAAGADNASRTCRPRAGTRPASKQDTFVNFSSVMRSSVRYHKIKNALGVLAAALPCCCCCSSALMLLGPESTPLPCCSCCCCESSSSTGPASPLLPHRLLCCGSPPSPCCMSYCASHNAMYSGSMYGPWLSVGPPASPAAAADLGLGGGRVFGGSLGTPLNSRGGSTTPS
jgi:hypothetical protein